MDIFTCSPQSLEREIEQRLDSSTISLVCFDFFDTLVTRSVYPENTKKIAASQLAVLLEHQVDGEFIYGLRSVLEKKLCDENVALGKDPEFALSDLAARMFGVMSSGLLNLSRFEDTHRFVDQFINIELAVEKNVQVLVEPVCNALKLCRTKGIKTAVVSDFYIQGANFHELLSAHGLSGFVDHLYVSSDYLITKGNSGALYSLVMEDLACNAEEILMIGDNNHADGAMALAKGIMPICIGKREHPAEDDIRQNAVIEKYEKSISVGEKHHFPEMAATLHYFIHNLFLQAYREKRQNLFFCSKEGEFLKKLFDQYQLLRFGTKIIETHYLLVSRKATFICSLNELANERFDRLFCHYRDMSVGEFLLSLNFTDEDVQVICRAEQLDPAEYHQNFREQSVFSRLMQSRQFESLYEQHRIRQKRNFLSYLESFGVDIQSYGLSLVDVGWKGSIQNNIYYSLGEEVEVSGYYIGLLTPTELTEKNRKQGLVFSDYPQCTEYIHVFNNNRSLFEMTLGASHGSADGYFTPQQFSMIEDDSHRRLWDVSKGIDEVRPAVLDLPKERGLFDEFIGPIQNCIEETNKRLVREMVTSGSTLPPLSWFARKHARAVFKPTVDEVEFYAALYHLENFGMFGFTNFEAKEKLSLFQRCKNLLRLKSDPAAYLETGIWPPVILRRLGLGFLTGLDGTRRYKRIFGDQRWI